MSGNNNIQMLGLSGKKSCHEKLFQNLPKNSKTYQKIVYFTFSLTWNFTCTSFCSCYSGRKFIKWKHKSPGLF